MTIIFFRTGFLENLVKLHQLLETLSKLDASIIWHGKVFTRLLDLRVSLWLLIIPGKACIFCITTSESHIFNILFHLWQASRAPIVWFKFMQTLKWSLLVDVLRMMLKDRGHRLQWRSCRIWLLVIIIDHLSLLRWLLAWSLGGWFVLLQPLDDPNMLTFSYRYLELCGTLDRRLLTQLI